MQQFVIKCISDLRQVSGFLRVPRFPSTIRMTGVINIWYFDPNGILTPGSIFIYGIYILTPLLKTEPSLYGKLNHHGIVNPLISNQEIGRGSIYHGWGGGQITMGRGSIYHEEGIRYTMGRGFNTQWVRRSNYHG